MEKSKFNPNLAADPNSGLYGLDHQPSDSRVVVIPVPFDVTTSYKQGASRGPEAILKASHQLDLFDIELGRPYSAGISMLPIPQWIKSLNKTARLSAEKVIAVGGVFEEGNQKLASALGVVNQACKKVQNWLLEQIKPHLQDKKIVCVLGGDHSVPLASIVEHARYYEGMGILHVDAHADLRQAYEGFEQSHASIMYNVLHRTTPKQIPKLVQVALRDVCEEEMDLIASMPDRIHTFFDADLWKKRHQGISWQLICEEIVSKLPQQVYISFDIDGLDPALCPNTGTPVAGGLSLSEVSTLLRILVESGRVIVGMDLTEVAPIADYSHEWDANVGMRLLYKMIGYALKSNKVEI